MKADENACKAKAGIANFWTCFRQPKLGVVGGQQRCLPFMMESLNNIIRNSSSLCYPSFSTMTTPISPSSKTMTTTNKQTNATITTRFLSSYILGNIDEEDDDNNDNNRFDNNNTSIAIEDDGQTVYITVAENSNHDEHKTSLENNNNNKKNISWGFSSPLLWVNDPQYIHPSSGQRVRTLGQYSKNSAIRTLLKIGWKSGEESIFDLNWLIENARNNCIGWMSKGLSSSSSSSSLKSSFKENKNDDHDIKVCSPVIEQTETTKMTTSVTKDIAISANSASVKTFDYQEIMENENILFEGLKGIFENGAILVRNAPTTTTMKEEDNDSNLSRVVEEEVESIVGNLGKRFSGGKLSHGSLYGDIFHVQSKDDAENIAYTNVALPPHQDLTYYESKPFLQLLHCVTNTSIDNNNNNSNDYIVGGQSVLIDAMAAANELRCIVPDLFDILCKTEAIFLKERNDADMVSPKSHIIIDPTYDQVVEINWSPPFEGPLQIHPRIAVEEYVLAYQAMECILDYDDYSSSSLDNKGCSTLLPQSLENILQDYAKQNTWEHSLQKGDILVFNNQRMLHGRRSFTSFGNAQRHLIGCYTDAMDTISQYRLLLRERDDKIGGGYGRRNPGNGCRWM
ncbi:gamma-butyrobetaine dioxygenase [Fragilariopsis cylindrus CCMP1102]|uniref:Gamma-butyrobetaine dioxygenase n=1 Tax=Fragilariopsis cylindrus CCMP1102 TaxID=635003 RepID=A0A1E7FSF0_9STRA|nr:gamma-butyrobetaine dioxygenase [Fragilariopsis cylindrus CCMP1102]|eukprot:OEU21037.1 gamma-butyrobetaine dioxygenase [Fragilariopsis cylindrus CCMP1102]